VLGHDRHLAAAVKPRFKHAVGLLAAMAVVLPVGGATLAAYTGDTPSSGNRIEAGSVDLRDNDSGSGLLSLSGAIPGDNDSGCIKVTYQGSLPSTVKLYGTTGGTGLDQYLMLKVTRGTYGGADPGYKSCAGFQPDATDYLGAGAGVVYNGTLQDYADDYATAVADPPGGAATWTTGEQHVYKLEVTLQPNLAAQGKTATQTFTWEARNQ
jgi:hypothetical protein